MPLIRITGTIDTDDLDPTMVDLSHRTGLTDYGYTVYRNRLEEYAVDLVAAVLEADDLLPAADEPAPDPYPDPLEMEEWQ